jgi:hypothetical protein
MIEKAGPLLRTSHFAASLLSLVMVAWSLPVQADLAHDIKQLTATWKPSGFQVSKAKSIFLERGQKRLFRLPTPPSFPKGCTSLVFLGTRNIQFSFSVQDPPDQRSLFAPSDNILKAQSGFLQITRCGDQQRDLEYSSLEMSSRRGAIEVLRVQGVPPPKGVEAILSDRFVSQATPPIDPGRPQIFHPLNFRTLTAIRTAKLNQASVLLQQQVRASSKGNGRLRLNLTEGCHRIELLADSVSSSQTPDLDAEIHAGSEGDELLARDRSDTPDAHLKFCLGQSRAVTLLFAGAPPGGRIQVLGFRWPTPRSIPTHWGARVTATMAELMRYRFVSSLPTRAMHVSLGVSGVTQVPIELEAQSCYLAMAATVRGEPSAVVLTAPTTNGISKGDGAVTNEGAIVSFCTMESRMGKLEVNAKGSGLAWVMSVWRTGKTPLNHP